MSQSPGPRGGGRGWLIRGSLAFLLLPLLAVLSAAAVAARPAAPPPAGPGVPVLPREAPQAPDCQAGGLPAGFEGWEDTSVKERRLTHDVATDVIKAATGEFISWRCAYSTKPVGSGWGVSATVLAWVEYDCQPDTFLQTQYVWQKRDNDIFDLPDIPVTGRTATSVSGRSSAYQDGGRHLIYDATRVVVAPLGRLWVFVRTESVNPPAPSPMEAAEFVDMGTTMAQQYMPVDTLGKRCGLTPTASVSSTPGTTLGVTLACQSNFSDPGLVVCTATPVNAPAGATITYQWSLDGRLQAGTGSELRLTDVSAGRHTVTVRATDTGSGQASEPESVTVDTGGAGRPGEQSSPLDSLIPVLLGAAGAGLAAVAVVVIIRNTRGKPSKPTGSSSGGPPSGGPTTRPQTGGGPGGGPAGGWPSAAPPSRPTGLPESRPAGGAPSDGGAAAGFTGGAPGLPPRPSTLPEAGPPSWPGLPSGGGGVGPTAGAPVGGGASGVVPTAGGAGGGVLATATASVLPLGAPLLTSPPSPPASSQQRAEYWFEADPAAITVRGDARDMANLSIRVWKRVGTVVTDAAGEVQVSVRPSVRQKIKLEKAAGGLQVEVRGLHLGTAPYDGAIEISGLSRSGLLPVPPLRVPVRVTPVPAQVRIVALKDGFHFQSYDEALARSCFKLTGYVTASRGPLGEEQVTIAHARCVAEVNVDGRGWAMFGRTTTDENGWFSFPMHPTVVALWGADEAAHALVRPVQLDLSEDSRTALKTFQTYAASIPDTTGFATAREQYGRYPGVFFRQLCKNEESDAKRILGAIHLLCQSINFVSIYRHSFQAQRSCVRTAISETFGSLTTVVIEFTGVVGLAWDFAHAMTHPNVLSLAAREANLGTLRRTLLTFAGECATRWSRWVSQTNALRQKLAKNLKSIWPYAKPSALPEFVSSTYEAEVSGYLRGRTGPVASGDATAQWLDDLIVKLVVGLVVTLVAVAMLPVYLITVLMLAVFVLLYAGASAIRAVGSMFAWGGVAGGREALIDAIEKGLAGVVGSLYDRIWGWNDAVRTQLMSLPPGGGATTPDLASWVLEAFPTVDDFDQVMGRALEEAMYLSEHLLVPDDAGAAAERVRAAEVADREAAKQWAEKVETMEIAMAALQVAYTAFSGMGYLAGLVLSRGAILGLGGLPALTKRFAGGAKALSTRAEAAVLRLSALCDKVGSAVDFGQKAWILWQTITDLELYRHVPQRRIGHLYRREGGQSDGR